MVIGESSTTLLRPWDLGIGPLFWKVRDALIVGDAVTGRIVLWNPAAQALFGYSAAQAIGMPLEALVPEELRAQHRAGMARYVMSGQGPLVDANKPITLPALRDDGTEIAIELILTSLTPPVGSIAQGRYVMANIRDATERLREAETDARLAAILQATPDAIIVSTSDGTMVTVNEQAERLTGYTKAELIGLSVDLLVPQRLRAGHGAHRATFGTDPQTRPMGAGLALTAQHKDGHEIPVEISLSPLQTVDGLHVISAIRDVSERRQAERERALLAEIVASTDDAVMCVNQDGLITAWNPGAERLYGYQTAEAIGHHVTMLIPPELMAVRNATFERIMRGERVEDFEAERLTKDDRRVLVSLATFPIRDADGSITGVASIARDITERRQVERDRALLAAIVESTDDSIIAIDRDDQITAWNPGAEKLYGYSADETIGRPGSMLVLPELAAQRQSVLAQILRGERVEAYESERLTKDGRRVRIWISPSPVRDVDGTIIGAASIARDVTEQRENEARLQEMETWYRILVERMPAATYLEKVDEDEPTWTTLYVSPQIEKMLGYPIDIWKTDPDFGPTLLHPDDRARVLAEDARTEATGEPYRAEYRMTANDGRVVWVRDEAVLVRDEAGRPKYWLGFMLDITEQQHLEAERAELLAAERETARRLEELSALRADFTRMVAHELGSPIAAVRRSAELLAIDPLSPNQERALAAIQKEVDELRALVDDVAAIATIERDEFTVDLRPVPIERIFGDAADFARTLPGGCPLSLVMGTVDVVMADPKRIGQALRNLLKNSALYSPPGTEITLSAVRCGDRVCVTVSDQGPGINTQDLHCIFEKYGRGRNASTQQIPGVGLGLYLSRQIVQAHGSDLIVESTPGQGATFRFELAVAP